MADEVTRADHVAKPFPDDCVVTLRGDSPEAGRERVGLRRTREELSAFRDMFLTSGDWFRGRDDDPYVTFVVVRDKNPSGWPEGRPGENDAFEAMSVALVTMLAQCSEDGHVANRVRQWCSSRIRKVVKRASGAKWDRLVSEAMTPLDDEGAEATHPFHGAILVSDVGPTAASAIVFVPMRASSQPKSLRRLQVSGLELDRTVWKVPPKGPVLRVVIDENVEMTSGKALAQAGHAVQLAFRYLGDDAYCRWADAGFHVDVSYGDVEGMSMAMTPDVIVTDAGFTEVRAGTRTCAAWLADDAVPAVSFD